MEINRKNIFLSLSILVIMLIGCKDKTVFETRKHILIDEENYVLLEAKKLNIPTLENIDEYVNSNNIHYRITGKLSGVSFEKDFKGVAIWDICVYNEKQIVIGSFDGIALYDVAQSHIEWIFRDEKIIVEPLSKIDIVNKKVYVCATMLTEGLPKMLIAIDLVSAKFSKFVVERLPALITVEKDYGVAEILKGRIIIKSIDGEFEFITEE